MAEYILNLLPVTEEEKAAFQAAAPPVFQYSTYSTYSTYSQIPDEKDPGFFLSGRAFAGTCPPKRGRRFRVVPWTVSASEVPRSGWRRGQFR